VRSEPRRREVRVSQKR